MLKQAQIEEDMISKMTKIMRSDDEKVTEAENEAKFNKKKDENAQNMY